MASGNISIEIPDQVFTTDTDYKPIGTNDRGGISHYDYTAKVLVGGVVVFQREYTGDWGRVNEPDFAEDEDAAVDLVLKAFGQKLKEVLA